MTGRVAHRANAAPLHQATMLILMTKNKGFFMQILRRLALAGLAATMAWSLAACGKQNAATPTARDGATGAGASFPAPLYAKWASNYAAATGAKINYQSVGSSAGMKQVEAQTVDFGASDEPLSDEALKAKGLVQFPTVIGGVVPVINIAGLASGDMVLDGPTLAAIYLGKITRWNDPAIVALNPTLALPDAAIAPVRRADGSGTSFTFTDYLSKTSPEWKEKIGTGKAVNWPVGTGGKGNEGVALFVARLPNSIGYVEYSYVKQANMTAIKLKNAAGHAVTANEDSFKAAAASADWQRSFHQILTNPPTPDAWPITSATYIMMQSRQDKPHNAAAVLKFFDWAYGNGDQTAQQLDYIAMPDEVKALIRQSWTHIQDANGQPIAYK